MIVSVLFDHEAAMKSALQPWQWFVLIPASWVNRQQQEVIEYLPDPYARLAASCRSAP
jgi:hypothetical protein